MAAFPLALFAFVALLLQAPAFPCLCDTASEQNDIEAAAPVGEEAALELEVNELMQLLEQEQRLV